MRPYPSHVIKDLILDRARQQEGPFRVERFLWEQAFPRPMSQGGGVAAAIMTLALIQGNHRPESTQEELADRFCNEADLDWYQDPCTGDVWVSRRDMQQFDHGAGTKDGGRCLC